MKSLNQRVMTMAFVGLFSAVSGSALAAGASSAFKSYDANSDGKVSMDEYEAQGGTKSTFGTIDADGSKSLSKDEFAKIESGSGYSGSTGSSGRPIPATYARASSISAPLSGVARLVNHAAPAVRCGSVPNRC